MEKLNILILDSNNKDRQELRKIIESTTLILYTR